MPKIIVTSRYMKAGNHSHLGNYVKYIATREGVALSEKSSAASKSQSELIKKLTSDFPEAVKLPEYQKYISAPSAKTASDCISAMIDENLDLVADREIYMKYLGTRPGVVKLGTHGLFSETDEPVVLDKAAREVAEHTGTVWTHVVSLRRDDAERMGYNNLSAWKNLVKRHIADIAEAQKIDLKNFRWYAAYHQKENNPHVHIVVYSDNPKEGYLTKQGIEKIRSVFVNDIYRDELQNLYQEQTKVRDDLRAESKKVMQSLLNELQNQNCSDALLESLLLKLSEQLKTAKGKKVYGYLQPQVKKTVDEIVAELAKNPTLQKMYDEWCKLEREKYLTYTSEPPQLPALKDNKVFKPIKNAVIQTALELRYPLRTPECEPPDQEEAIDVETDDTESQEEETSEEHLQKAADRNNPYAMYRLARLYLNSEPPRKVERAVELLERSAGMQNGTAAYALGRLYLYGTAVERDEDRAREWLEYSASLGNEYAARLLEDMRQYQNYGVQRAAVGLLRAFARMISDSHRNTSNSPRLQTDRKLRSMIRRKKLALGLKESHEIRPNY